MMAIHDATYATRPESWTDLMWRMQYLSEMRVGTRMREVAYDEDARVRRSKEALDGVR